MMGWMIYDVSIVYKGMSVVDYSKCKFEARLQKNHFLRKNESFYLYVSDERVIINTEPYAKKPWIEL